jgi:hypothetical protein
LEAITNYEALSNGNELLIVGERGEKGKVFVGFDVHLMLDGFKWV